MTYKIRYKVLADGMRSPYQGFKFVRGRWYHEPRIGMLGGGGCHIGLYAGGIESLLYHGIRPGFAAYRCEVRGKQSGVQPLKECWEYMRVVDRLNRRDVVDIAKRQEGRLGYTLSEALYPVNPLAKNRRVVRAGDLELLRRWASVRDPVRDSVRDSVLDSVGASAWDSVWDSIRASVWTSVWDSVLASVEDSVEDSVLDSVWASVWGSVWDSVEDSVEDSVLASVWASVWGSVWDSVWAYVGSLFPGIENWKYIDHNPGVYPFQPAADLWRFGLIPSYDGSLWRLHGGKNADVLWEGKL